MRLPPSASLILRGLLLLVASVAAPLASALASDPVTEEEAYQIGVEAYTFFYPLISMDLTRKVMTNVATGSSTGAGPANAFHHIRTYPTADFKEVVRPNFDTLYSIAWLDLTQEPMIISVPDTNGRYYLLPMLDMWSDVFAVPGKRTSGTVARSLAVVPPHWKGSIPNGVERIDAPTPFVWIIGRTQTNGPKDYAAVHQIQEGYTVTPLSRWGKKVSLPKARIDPSVDMKTPPLRQVNTLSAAQYFSYAAELIKLHPPHPTDWSILARLRRIGIEQGKSFNLSQSTPAIKNGLERAVVDGLKMMQEKAPSLARVVNGWQMNTDTMGVYGNHYLKRAVVAMIGLGANQPEDAVYPLLISDSNGKALEGGRRYLLHFSKEELPPVSAFWSITMYDAEGFQVANSLNRFAIGDRDALKYNPDGSLDIYIQHTSPGADKESNWLPSPAQGQLGVTMRLYAPKPMVLDGRWAPPAVKAVTD